MSHAGRGSVADQLEALRAQIAHVQATLDRVLDQLNRIAGKPLPDATNG